MRVGELLYQVAERGVTLRCGRTEDRLQYSPAGTLEPGLLDELREHKREIIRIMREDERLRETDITQSERQVLDLARERFPRREGDTT